MMRVLLVMTAREVGGAEVYVERIVGVLRDRCTFTIALSDHPEMQAMRGKLSSVARIIALPLDRTSALPSTTRTVQNMAREHDVVHLNSSHPGSRLGIAMGFALGAQPTPFITVEHRATPLDDIVVPRMLKPILPTLFRRSRQRASKIIAVSQQNASVLHRLYGIPKDKIAGVPNGVPASEGAAHSESPLRTELGLRDDQLIVLVLARLQANKGHRYLIDAAPTILAHVPGAHFVFAGMPDDRAPLDARIAQLGLTGSFSIVGARSDVPRLLREANVFVLPSLSEGFSLALIEALAAGVPTVATNVGGAPEVIRDGVNGWLVPPANTDALAQTVIRALTLNTDERNVISHEAAATGKRYSVEAMADATLAVYRIASNTSTRQP